MYGTCNRSARDLGFLHEAMSDLFSGARGTVHEFPPVNVWANDDGAIVKAELPGIHSEHIDISVVNDTLTISGKRTGDDLKDAQCLRRERLRGEFARALNLPFKVDGTAVTAHFDKGVLTVTLPRAESDKPRKIAIKTA